MNKRERERDGDTDGMNEKPIKKRKYTAREREKEARKELGGHWFN